MKKFFGIIIISFIWSGSSLANNIFNIECVTKAKKVFDVNKKNVANDDLMRPWVFTFDERKEKLIEMDFKTKKDAPVFITEAKISWHQLMFSEEDRIAHMAKYFNMQDADSNVHVFDIDRYSGEYKYSVYDLNKFWTYKYLGINSKKDLSNYDLDKLFNKEFLVNSTKILNQGIKETSNNIPQKDIIHTSIFTGQCKKIEKKKKF